MRSRPSQGSKVAKRSTRACERCRSMKVKCSGAFPCARCERKKERCRFVEEENRVSVPESYLFELERRYNGTQPRRSIARRSVTNEHNEGHNNSGPIQVEDEPSQIVDDTNPPEQTVSREEVASDFRRNPLVDADLTFVKDPNGRHRYMGPSSTWAFCRRVLALIGQRMPEVNSPPDPFNVPGEAFKMQWTSLPADQTPDVTNLPPLDYAIFAFNTVKYHLGLLFQVVDEEAYLRNLHEFYDNPKIKSSQSRYWYAEYLLILAFGKVFTMNAASTSLSLGNQHASRAMALMPDLTGSYSDPLLCIEVLCLASLYFQSLDMRHAAFLHIGQAVRICIIEGIHRHMPDDVVGPELSERCNIIFWTVYILDREFSALMGGPMSVRDEDITTDLPSQKNNSTTAINMTLQIRLSRLTAQILTTVYGVGKEFDGALLRNTQSILYILADLSRDLSHTFSAQFQGSISQISRTTTRLMLSYHHCVVLTTRPLVMCVLQKRLASTQPQLANNLFLSPAVSSLLHSCVDSALNILKTLRTLQEEDLLDNFLPFQLECAFSSGFVLCIIRTVAPSLIQDDSWSESAHTILDSMIAKSSIGAPLRKRELEQLEQIMVPLSPTDGQDVTMTTSNQPHEPTAMENVTGVEALDPAITNDPIDNDFSWDFLAPNVGLSAEELQDLADQLEDDIGIWNVPDP